jgi:oligopeptidase B
MCACVRAPPARVCHIDSSTLVPLWPQAPPYAHGDFFYYTRTVEGKSYPIYCRKPGTRQGGELVLAADAAEQVILDVNKLGEGKSHCDIRSVKPSPDHTLITFAADYTGNETYSISVLNLATGALVEDLAVTGVHGGCTWGKDNTTYFYVKEDEAKRPYQVRSAARPSSRLVEALHKP